MRHLFSPEGERALAAVIALKPLLAFDFDGTLAPIVARPGDAQVSLPNAALLRRLSALQPVAIVTGRRVADVVSRLGFEPHYIIGNHGAEDPATGLSEDLGLSFALLRTRIDLERHDLRHAGIDVEDKGYSLALHYRLAPNHRAALARIDALLAGLDPRLKAFGGRYVVNVVAVDAPDKGDAVAALVVRTDVQAALFVGDDVNDEAVFERAQSSEPHWLTVRIGRDYPRSRAGFFLHGHDEIDRLLDKLLAQLGAGGMNSKSVG